MLFKPIQPMLITAGNEPFDDEEYIFEPKWDGMRIQLHKDGGRIEAYARNGMNMTAKFPELRRVALEIHADSAVLDCEGICLRDGKPAFDDFAFRNRLSHSMRIEQAQHTYPATFVAFDVLLSDGIAHLDEPLMKRKRRLHEILRPSPVLTPTMYQEGQGRALFELTRSRDLEGIVAKRKASLYLPGVRSPDWLKIKHVKTVDTVILGYRIEPFALVVGMHFRTVKNKPVAVVDKGIAEQVQRQFIELSKGLHTVKDAETQWIEPKLVCRIQYLDRTDTHQLKQTRFEQLLLNKSAEECVWLG